ncbi:MAG TPA: hypothetical protein VHX38_00445 [Pseudonocardiaceae bacterium]|jgi:hypothetical protein|nr:hypothetical protein [Pseudonocardiaceae bacterium]
MMLALGGIAAFVVALLVIGFLMDRRSRRRGDRLNSAGDMAARAGNARRDVKAWDRAKRGNLGDYRRGR